MATSEVAQEIADLTPEPVEPVAAQEKPSRLQARIDRFVSTIKQQGQQIAKQQEQIARLEAGDFAGLLTEQRNEITKLTLERGELLDRVRQHHQRAKRA